MQHLPKITIQRKLYAQLYRKIVHNRRINNYERGVRLKKKNAISLLLSLRAVKSIDLRNDILM